MRWCLGLQTCINSHDSHFPSSKTKELWRISQVSWVSLWTFGITGVLVCWCLKFQHFTCCTIFPALEQLKGFLVFLGSFVDLWYSYGGSMLVPRGSVRHMIHLLLSFRTKLFLKFFVFTPRLSWLLRWWNDRSQNCTLGLVNHETVGLVNRET